MENRELALKIAETIEKKHGQDITIINMADKSSFTDYFILASGKNERIISAIADDVEDEAVKLGLKPKSVEGKAGSGWILIDIGDIIVNAMTVKMRERYSIEKLWEDCELIHVGEDV